MKTTITLSRQNLNCTMSPTGLVTLLLVFISLVGNCEAQSNVSFVAFVPFTVVLFIAFVCLCFWICFIINRHKQRHITASRTTTTQYTYNAQRPNQATYPQSHAGGGQPYPLQSYVSSSRVLYPPPTGAGYNTSQTIVSVPEPISLPEATLHQGDAPPGYEEAIRMTTINIEDQPKQ